MIASMDCRRFRAQHLAYLDDTLPGDEMARAQQHLLGCDACAAHDTLVRRSLVLARNHVIDVAPSDDFRRRLDARLAACREASDAFDDDPFLTAPSSPRRWRARATWLAMAASVGVVATTVLQEREGRAAEPELPPVLAAAPRPATPVVSPAMVQALSTGNPMWSVVQLLDEMPAQALAAHSEFSLVAYER
jgi:hypothetical protein